jgi:hypothetical protein
MPKSLPSLQGSKNYSLDGVIESRLINLIRSNSKFRNSLYDVVTNADSVDEDLRIIMPGVDFTGLDRFQTASILSNVESIRSFLREAAKNSKS